MPKGATLDVELLTGLQQARKKKPRNFCLIAKGPEVLKLIVQKKKVNEGQIQKAKSEVKGNVVITGVVVGEGAELTFEVVGEEPSLHPKKIKDFIAEQAELTVKPKWSVVTELSEVESDEVETTEDTPPPAPPPPMSAESSAQTTISETGATETAPVPPPPSTPGSSPADGLLKELIARMNKLGTTIQAAAQANPQRKADLLKLVAAFQGQVKAKDASGAQESLKGLALLLKELTAGGAPVPPPPSTPPTGETVPPPPTAPPSPPQAKGESEQAEGETQDTSAASEAADEFRKNWAAARKTLREAIDKVEQQLGTLAEALLKSNDLNMIWVAEEGLTELLGGLRASATTIDKSSSKTPAKVAAFAKPALAELQKRLQSAQVKVCDKNKFGVKVSIDKTISAAIDEMQKVLDTTA